MASSPSDRAAIQSWLSATESFLMQEGGGLAVLALLDLLEAGHQAAAPIMVTWIEGRLTNLLGQLGEEGFLEPWKVLLDGAAHGVWSLYLHNVPTPQAFLAELPPKSRTAFFNRANFLRLPVGLVALTETPEQRRGLRAALVANLASADGPRAERLREIYPERFLAELPPSLARENVPASPYRADLNNRPSVWAITPGGSAAPLWEDWLAQGHLGVGSEESDWDEIPDLHEFPDKETFYARYREEGWNDKRDALWTVRSLKPGDLILANQGRTRILGIGVVQAPGYVFRADRTRQRHTVRVQWDQTRAKVLEKPGPRWLYTVHPVPFGDLETWFGPYSSEVPCAAEPELEKQEEIAQTQGAFDPMSIEDARERVMAAIVRRRGQQAFREALLQRYGGRCAVTGCDVVAVLEAAHIVPYMGITTNHPENGLLLRADIHTLFDLGLLGIGADLRVILHPSLHGSSHSELHGRPLLLPTDPAQRPSQSAIAAHLEWSGLHV